MKTINPDFKVNKMLAVNKSNAQHNEIKTRLVVAAKSNALTLNNMNLNMVLPEVSTSYFNHCLTGVQNEKPLETWSKLQQYRQVEPIDWRPTKSPATLAQWQSSERGTYRDKQLLEAQGKSKFYCSFCLGARFEKYFHYNIAKRVGEFSFSTCSEPWRLPNERKSKSILQQRNQSNTHRFETQRGP